MTTGWKAASESRRVHTKAKLKKNASGGGSASKKRRIQAKNMRSARLLRGETVNRNKSGENDPRRARIIITGI